VDEVTRLLDQVLSAGVQQVLFQARHLPSGLYFYRLEAGRFQAVRAMTLIQ
jgi:hypothetical protein